MPDQAPWTKYAATSDGPWTKYKPAPASPKGGGFLTGAYLGAMSDWDRAAEALARGAGDVVHTTIGEQQWMPGASLQAKDLAAEQAFRKEYQNQSGFEAGNVVGQIAATLPTASIGGEVSGLIGLGAKALGAAGAGLESSGAGSKNATEGAGIGLATAGAFGAAGKAVKKWVLPEARRLMNEGVRLTPGQMKGGIFNNIEQKLSGTLPLTGDIIKRARDQSIHDWNTATLNKTLKAFGEKLTGQEKSGYGVVKEAGDKISAAYDKVLNDPNLKFVITKEYANDVADIEKESDTLPSAQKEQFKAIVNYALNDPQIKGLPTGRQVKASLALLGRYSRKYSSDPDAGFRHMAELLRDYQTAIKDCLAQSNPTAAQKLKVLDNSWAQLVRIEGAAGRRAASDGVFMPSDLLAAEKTASNSVRRRSFSRGEGLLQGWARDAQKVLPAKVPDSGTAGRYMMDHGLATLAGVVGEAEAPHYAIPAVIGTATAALPYTKPGIAAVNALAQPAATKALSKTFTTIGQYTPGPASLAITGGDENP